MKLRSALICLFTLVIMAMLVVGCGEKSTEYTVGIGQFGAHGSLDNCREGFLQGLAEAGIVEGENLVVDYQNAQFDGGTSNLIAQTFVSKKVDLICAIATPMAQAAFNAADGKDIPVVYTAITDPVAAMLTEGNVTGTSDKLPVEAQLKLIRELLPQAKRIGILYTTSEVNSASTIAEYQALAGQYGFEIVAKGISAAVDIPLAMDNILTQVDCLSNLTDNTVVGSLPVMLDKAYDKGIPIFGSEIEQVKLGCVACEGLEYFELGKQTGRMAAKILKGEAKASELPFETIDQSSLYVNQTALERLGLNLSSKLADRAIEVGE